MISNFLTSNSNRLKNVLFRITHWETWDWRIKYIPLVPAWLWYCLRSGSFWFFTPSNPTLTFGGFDGESKKEMYDQLPPGSYPRSIYISHSLAFSEAEKLSVQNKYKFPFAVKPDVGKMGFMFRRINTLEEFKAYHEKMPVDYILQELVTYPIEVSVFYYRYPNKTKGTITGFLKKEYLEVTGDGQSTLWELILQYPRVRFRLEEMKSKHAERLNEILPTAEIYYLSYALNLSRGGKLVSLEHEKDERLLKIFDSLSNYTKNFYYGRYDIKCATIEDLKQGKNFSILEYNGSGAEPHHVYGQGNSLVRACKILADHWGILYAISRHNYKKGIQYWNFKQGLTFLKGASRHLEILRKLDTETQIK